MNSLNGLFPCRASSRYMLGETTPLCHSQISVNSSLFVIHSWSHHQLCNKFHKFLFFLVLCPPHHYINKFLLSHRVISSFQVYEDVSLPFWLYLLVLQIWSSNFARFLTFFLFLLKSLLIFICLHEAHIRRIYLIDLEKERSSMDDDTASSSPLLLDWRYWIILEVSFVI